MAGKAADSLGAFPTLGKDQTAAMQHVQKELLDTYEQASRMWLARVKSEADLWSELAAKLAATRSAPEAMEAYRQCIAQRMQMAAEDGRRLFDDCQKIATKVNQSLSNGWPSGSK